jgi:hypothetical protein
MERSFGVEKETMQKIALWQCEYEKIPNVNLKARFGT